MANPTTNFGWQMPTASDLVTDLPADFEVFGQAVDTALVDLKGGTTGQILAKASNTNMDFTWIANDQGDITGVTASSPLTGGGTSGAITVGIQDGTTAQKGAVQLENSTSSTSTTTAAVPASVKSAYDLANAAIPKSLIDAEGDLIVGTADNTVGRIAIGANGTVLQSNGTTASWGTPASAGGMTLLSTTTLSGTSTTISSISGAYTNLAIYIFGMKFNTTGAGPVVKFNNATEMANIRHIGYGATSVASQANTGIPFNLEYNTYAQSSGNNSHFISLENYASSTAHKPISGYGSWDTGSSTERHINSGSLITNSAISSMVIETGTAATFSAGTVLIYGVK